ncbi:Protein of unknown function, DUF600 [Anaeromicropila populeti]|uniref:DUF600 family protein n=2 Tax=Anaeromicropila populeti TaxID=37658 RepID=A0A1I6JA12_9FIRM|nr:Protein of unknown function, DUF600 [Anaeromicropila populeti]
MVKESRLSKFYKDIAEKVDSIIPVEWSQLAVYAEIEEKASVSFYFYSTYDSKIYECYSIPKEFGVSEEEYQSIMEDLLDLNSSMREEFIEEEEKPFTKYVFLLDSKWNYKMEFKYAKDDEESNLERVLLWEWEDFD